MMAFGELKEVVDATGNHRYSGLILAQPYYVGRHHTAPYILWKILTKEDSDASGSLIYPSSASFAALCGFAISVVVWSLVKNIPSIIA